MLTKGLRGYRLRERLEAQFPGCLGEAPTADALGISKEAGRHVPLAYASGCIWPQSVTFLIALTALVLNQGDISKIRMSVAPLRLPPHPLPSPPGKGWAKAG
jgi:hypothetical protein